MADPIAPDAHYFDDPHNTIEIALPGTSARSEFQSAISEHFSDWVPIDDVDVLVDVDLSTVDQTSF